MIQIPEIFEFLFRPARYKVAYGGRGSAKSHSYARALLIQATTEPLRILCAREIQKSIKDSVHRLLSDLIAEMGLTDFYDILDTEIRGRNGALFLFSGLSDQTASTIKSLEGCDICWAEEAQTISKRSWNLLIPTIRVEQSEIWVTFNPELDTDETYQRFVVNPPPGCITVEVNWHDNPWFPSVLEQERQHCLLTNKEDYDNIWEGKCRLAVSGAIYASEIADAVRHQRICNIPYDPKLKVHTIWDLGWNDSMAVIMAQRIRSEIRVIDYIEDSHKTIDWYVAELQTRRWNWGWDFLPHDGQHRDYKTGKSAEEILKAFGRKVKITPSFDVESGIKMARATLPQTYFDKTKTARLVECLKRYRRSINKQTNEAGAPVHDEFSHGADDYRYLAINAEQMTNENDTKRYVIAPQWEPADAGAGY